MGINGFIFRKINKYKYIKEKKEPWEPYYSILLGLITHSSRHMRRARNVYVCK